MRTANDMCVCVLAHASDGVAAFFLVIFLVPTCIVEASGKLVRPAVESPVLWKRVFALPAEGLRKPGNLWKHCVLSV